MNTAQNESTALLETPPSWQHLDPELVVLGPRPGIAPSQRPPVRIFLGTEDAQLRAERIFFYSIERVRDPARTYEIYLMKNLAGFDTRTWRTNFTNYRFAIPDFAGGRGRAIYNDVDEIYLADPGELFDRDMASHGYLAVSAQDTSVMLIACERMAAWWNRDRAQRLGKAELLAGPAAQPGLWGPLEGEWNARDLEYVEGRSKCVHFTALHTQPWQPTPEQYSYHHHPLADVWDRLERAADAEAYEVFGGDHASVDFVRAAAAARNMPACGQLPPSESGLQWIAGLDPATVLRCSFGRPRHDAAAIVPGTVTDHDVAVAPQLPATKHDAVAALDLLEHVPLHDTSWILDQAFDRAVKGVYAAVVCPSAATGSAPRSPDWWRSQMAAAARRRPGPAWRLELFREGSGARLAGAFEAPPRRLAAPPRVWLLFGNKTGDNQQTVSLADALGWPYEVKRLVFNSLRHVPALVIDASLTTLDREKSDPLDGPWPDLVITVGKRTVPIARWIRAQAGGRSRLVHLGRPWAPISWFDLIITTPQYRLPARPNILHNTMPLNHANRDGADLTYDPKLKEAIEALPQPRIAVLVGGNSSSHVLTEEAARRLGEEASRLANHEGGSLLVTTSRRTPAAALRALRLAIKAPARLQAFGQTPVRGAYETFLALADAFLVTGDSASMLAEACSTRKPVHIFPLPHRYEQLPGARAVIDLVSSWRGGRVTYRGTPKQQDVMGRLYDRFVDYGLVTPPRDLEAYHEALEVRGLATRVGTHCEPISPTGPNDLQRAVERVRELFLAERRVGS